MENLSSELAAFLREEVGIVPAKGEAKFPTRKQALGKGFYNRLNLTQGPDGSWTPNF